MVVLYLRPERTTVILKYYRTIIICVFHLCIVKKQTIKHNKIISHQTSGITHVFLNNIIKINNSNLQYIFVLYTQLS